MILKEWIIILFVFFPRRFHVNVIRGAFNRLTYELIINGVVDGKDYGEYRCQAINDLGITSSYVTLESKFFALLRI